MCRPERLGSAAPEGGHGDCRDSVAELKAQGAGVKDDAVCESVPETVAEVHHVFGVGHRRLAEQTLRRWSNQPVG